MKILTKFIVFVMVMEAVVVCFSGCSTKNIKKYKKNVSSEENIEVLDNGDMIYKKKFGTYVVGNGWIESKSHSKNEKYFYVKDGQDNEKKPNNISINEGKNKYKKSEHELFKKAIYAQIVRQASGVDSKVLANGSTSDNGEIVYTFVIEGSDSVVKQYYIVGENTYILVHETIWDKGEEKAIDEIANKMVNTFKWND